MVERKAIFIYPLTPEVEKPGSNNYIRELSKHLCDEFTVVNKITRIGLLDAFAKFKKTDVYYFNWIEDLPTKRFGLLQILLLSTLLCLCKLTNKKVVWFVHNNISHDNKLLFLKRAISWLMSNFADLILSHSSEIKILVPKKKLRVFHHPVKEYRPLQRTLPFQFDLLIWGSVSPYKGVAEFVEYAVTSPFLVSCKIAIAGKFSSSDYYERVSKRKWDNLTLINRTLDEKELENLFSRSQYILFTYSSMSVLSSAALCDSISYGKEVIAPNIGSFKELGDERLLHNYESFETLEKLLIKLKKGDPIRIDARKLRDYIENTTWQHFISFVKQNIDDLYEKNNTIDQKSCRSSIAV